MNVPVEEKLVSHLVTRLGKLLAEIPVPNGVEEMPKNDMIRSIEEGLIPLCSQNLTGVLTQLMNAIDALTKQTTATEEASIRAALTLVYLLSLFTRCCQHKWDFIKEAFQNIQGVSEVDKIRLQEKQEMIRPPPLEDRLARDCYGKITPLVIKPQPVFGHKIQKAAARALFLLSVYNYDAIIGNLTQHMLPHCNPSEEDIASQLHLLQYLNNDATQLAELLKKVDSANQTYRKDKTQFLLARVLRRAIWNWIDNYPIQFVSLCQGSLKLQGNPEQLFDVFATWSGGSSKKDRAFWPTQTMLLVLCPEIMRKIAKGDTVCDQFAENLKKGIRGAKKVEVATICYVDICKAATFVSNSEKGNFAHIIVSGVEKELKERLFHQTVIFKNEEGAPDEALMIDCLVSLFMLSPDKISQTLMVEFGEASNSLFKHVLVKALLRIATQTTLPWNPSISDIYDEHSGRLRRLFQEFKGAGHAYLAARASGKKGAEKQVEKASYELNILVTLIELFASDPALALHPTAGKEPAMEIRDLLTGLCECEAMFEVPELHEAAFKALVVLHKPENIGSWDTQQPQEAFWIVSSDVVRELASHLIREKRWEAYEVKKTIQLLHQLLTSRNQFLEANPGAQPTPVSSQLRQTTSSMLESAFLIHLPSIEMEIASLSAQCIGLLCEEVDHIRARITEAEHSILANYDAYQQLGAVSHVTTGREVQQRAIRKVLRQVEQPTNGNYTAWYKLYDRFKLFTSAIIRNIELEAEKDDPRAKQRKEDPMVIFADIPKALVERPNELLVQWTHYLNFLSAMAAVSIGRKAAVQTSQLPGNAQVEVVDEFLRNLMEYLVHDSVNIRSAVKTACGSSLSPAVYPSFFDLVSEQIAKLKGSSGDEGTNVLFVDQVILVLRLIIENAHPSHLVLLSNIEELIINMIRFVRQLILNSASLQIKHKLAGLIEGVMHQSTQIPFQNEHKFRSQLVDSIIEWTSEFSSKETAISAENPADASKVNIKKLIQDLDLQVMSAISALLKKLPLQGKDDEAKAEAFSKLFTFFTRLLDRCQRDPSSVHARVPEVTIEAMSFLVAANIEHGLDYFKEMGYHKNDETRAAFLKVLANILKQGTDFDTAEDDGVDKYGKLAELIFDPRLDTILTLCEVTPITEVEAISQLCVRVFESNNSLIDLIKASIVREVQVTEKANTLFRLNSFATKLMAHCCKLIGVDYLRSSLGSEIRSILANARPMEMDPALLPSGQNLDENFQNIKGSVDRFLADIKKTISDCPRPLREICAFLQETVGAKFPGAEHTAIAGFIFLRFLCPAVTNPDGNGVINTTIQDRESRRSVILVAKVLQNLANRCFFVKEPFMEPFNPWIEEHIPEMRDMLDTFAQVPEDAPVPQLSFTEEQREADMGALHYYLVQSREKMAKAPSAALSTDNGEDRKDNWLERLNVLLSQLGEPPQPSTKKSAARPFTPGGKNTHYEEFMKRMAKQETEFLKSRNIYYADGKTKGHVPVLYYIASKLYHENEQEKLLYFILKTMQSYFAKKYVLVVDLTGFTMANAFTLPMVAQMAKMLPPQAFENLEAVYLVHPSTAFRKYVKRISKYLGQAQKKIVVCSFVEQLYEFIREPECRLPDTTVEADTNVQSTFSPVTEIVFNKKSEVELRIGKDSFQVVSLKPQPILHSSGHLVDLIPIAGITSVSPGQKDNEVILKLESGGQVIHFLSKSAGQIIQQLNDSLERHRLTRPQSKSRKRFSPSDVPGTLLNMALLNLTSANPSLRVAAYNLLTAACQTFSFNMNSVLVAGSDIALARNCMHFVIRISTELSKVEPGLTLELISEALSGMSDKNIFMLNILRYMKPWLSNLSQFARSGLKGADKTIESTIQSLIAMTVRESRDNMPMLLSNIWKPIGHLEELFDTVMDCLLNFVIPSNQLDTKKINCAEDIVITLATKKSQLIAGKIISMMHSHLHQSDHTIERLENSEVWLRIEICLRWLMSLTFENLVSLELFMPELLHIIVMVFGTGDALVRADSYALFINLVHAIFTSRVCHKDKHPMLRTALAEFQSVTTKVHFGVKAAGKNFDPYQSQEERDNKLERTEINTVENVAQALVNLLNCCSKGNCIGTIRHARWLSLTSVSAFAGNNAIQARAVVTMGVLAASPELVSTDLFGQLLFLLKVSLVNSSEKKVDDLSIALVKCLGHLYPHLSPWSKFFKPFFWLAVSLTQIHDADLFLSAVTLLGNVVSTLHDTGHFQADGLSAFCMSARKGTRLEPLLDKFDQMNGVNFDTSFSFAISTILLKGLKRASVKAATVNTLSSILRLCNESSGAKTLGYFAGLLPIKGDDDVELVGRLRSYSGQADNSLCNKAMCPDKAHGSLLFYYLATILKSSDLEVEQHVIYRNFLHGIHYMPDIFPIVFEPIKEKLAQVLSNSQNGEILAMVHQINHEVFEHGLAAKYTSASTNQTLQNLGYLGLQGSDQFNSKQKSAQIQIACSVLDAMMEH